MAMVLGPEYDPKFYLWHLEALGMVTAGAPVQGMAAYWDAPGDPIEVALIDTGFCLGHENLPPAAQGPRIDFAAKRHGAVYDRGTATPPMLFGPNLEARLAAMNLAVAPAGPGKRLKDFLDRGTAAPLTRLAAPDPADRFGGHGTACAGLVAGRAPTAPRPPGVIGYCGVDPGARVMSISTPYNHEIRPIILALLYAVDQGAEVILMPRGVNPLDHPADPSDPRATRFDTDPGLQKDQALFEWLLAGIAAAIPVVVAAGNDGRAHPAYPARLAARGAPDLIVAGAHTARGLRAAYSSGSHATGVTAYCPADDAEVVDTALYRIDQRSLAQGLDPGAHLTRPNGYSPFGVLALDIPGRAGRSPGPGPDDTDADGPGGRGSRYCVFGGTSAAASILAGLVSLMQRAAKRRQGGRPLTGADAKTILAAQPPQEGAANELGLPITPLDALAILRAVNPTP